MGHPKEPDGEEGALDGRSESAREAGKCRELQSGGMGDGNDLRRFLLIVGITSNLNIQGMSNNKAIQICLRIRPHPLKHEDGYSTV